MVKEHFREVRFRGDTARYLEQVIMVIDRYQQMGYKMTLRQLYYQLVVASIIANQKKEYARLSDILTRARMGGLVDWGAIEDRVRVPKMHSEWDDIAGLVESACASYRLPRWSDQEYYVELWTEKEAIAGILSPITDKWHILLSINRGYSSATAMHDAAKRFIEAEGRGKKCVLLYLGDHDPSGLDMDRDIADRLAEFRATVDYIRIGLTWAQIQQYNPPPNPAKFQDPRARDYIARFGQSSWEVDALPPNVLNPLVEQSILQYLNQRKYRKWVQKENGDKTDLKNAASDILDSR